ncbi:helix-turn-helix domain-containing protein [Aerosakkonema sp. BLCC-F183]|uniref:helix-turn-helix domain-containing protein n=1 Tax=Aerosakkonema sp. BLCC-F183 TaxID=3342834 RepID=UPI0035B6AE4A
MKVKTQLAELRAKYGNLSYEEIAAYTEIDRQQLSALENNEASSIEFVTLAKLCSFFKCTPNDLLIVNYEEQEIEPTPPTAEALLKAREIIKEGFALADTAPPRPAQEIWAEFEAVRSKVATEISNSEQVNKIDVERITTGG